MLQNTATIETKYKLFIERAAAAELVWGLKNKQGWANSSSVEDEDIRVIPFWSDKAYAKACARDDWKSYLPAAIPMAEFLESWCIDMAESDTLVGVNWDADMFGNEADGLQVALALLNQLKANNSTISFLNYDGIDDFIAQINDVPGDDE